MLLFIYYYHSKFHYIDVCMLRCYVPPTWSTLIGQRDKNNIVKLVIKTRTKNASPYKETDDGRVSFNMAKSLLQSVSSKL